MTLQPSLIIWTVICFAVLMLVLSKLLFKPLLSFMDARNEKIAHAKELAEKLEKERAGRLAALSSEREAMIKERDETNKRNISEYSAQAAAELKALEAEYAKRSAELRVEYEYNDPETDAAIESAMDEMVAAFSGKFVMPR
jgi:F-type H+-transporting ATPase subunit b